MTLIKMDFSEMESLNELINSACVNCENIIERIKDVRIRMENAPEIMIFTQITAVFESLDNCLSRLYETKNSLMILRNVIVETPDRFAVNEKEMINTIKELTVKLDVISQRMIKIINYDETEVKD